MQAVENVLREGKCMTGDMGGSAKTVDLGKAIAEAI